jgi:cell division protein FtsW (lipid II flippase)
MVFLFRPINGARRWIPLGFFNFQPSEMAKLTFILGLASHLRFRENYRRLSGLLFPFGMTLVPIGLILKEPNLGTALLFLPVLYAMLFAAGARPRHLISVACLGVAVLPVLWLGMSAEQQSRITAVFTQQDGGPAPKGDNYHLHQSKQVLALGGVWGSELAGDAVQDPYAYHLPEAQTDFIFCMIGERWGLLGCLAMLTIYLILFGRGLSIAAATRDPFGRLLAVGIVALLATQTVINTGMTVGLMPITGLTLPLASYGGSSLLTTSLAVGLLINVGMRRGYELAGEPFRFRDD